jgi:hypothetical protein
MTQINVIYNIWDRIILFKILNSITGNPTQKYGSSCPYLSTEIHNNLLFKAIHDFLRPNLNGFEYLSNLKSRKSPYL